MAQGRAYSKRLIASIVGLCLLVAACSQVEPIFTSNDPNANAPRSSASQGRGYPYTPQPDANPDMQQQAIDNPFSLPPTRVVKVGLLLPLSGRSEAVGKALRDAAVMGLYDKYSTVTGQQATRRVELITKDTQGTADGARQAATEAVKEGATLLLGPLFSRNVEAIKPLAQTGKVTIITFSNDERVAGDGVFTLGFDPSEQARRMAEYTYSHGITNVASFAPRNTYGRQVIKAFGEVAELLGHRIKPDIRYSLSGGALQEDIRTLSREGTVGAKFIFEGLFLPESSDNLAPILSALRNMNITPQTIRFLGTGLWDDRALVEQHQLYGAWLVSSPPQMYEGFEQRFINSYGRKPPRIASLAYDAVALAATLVTRDMPLNAQSLSLPGGFQGPANGLFRFNRDGTTERGLAVLEITRQGFQVLDPAPKRFR